MKKLVSCVAVAVLGLCSFAGETAAWTGEALGAWTRGCNQCRDVRVKDEWGEGEIGYPNAEHGFGILESVRNTFGRKPAKGWPVNCAPEDVGLVCPQKVRK